MDINIVEPIPLGEYTQEQLTEFEIMDGMNEVNCQMADEIDKKLSEEQPTCHFTKMDYEDGFWICKHCGNEIESEISPPYDDCEYDY